MQGKGSSVKDVTHILITHYHIDHGAIAQEMKDKGAKLIVMESQKGTRTAKKIRQTAISIPRNKKREQYTAYFQRKPSLSQQSWLGREIISTTGHSEDHVALVLDEGIAFTGDLPPENGSPDGSAAFKDWQRLRSMKVTRVFPAHG